jgi:pimeloyl-ACP methyl ester carboxylesterase
MQQKQVALGPEFADLRLAWLEWGEPDAGRTVVCVHGLTRNAHDFDLLARALAGRGCRVLAVDVAGRGASGWLADPSQYQLPVYVAQLERWLELLRLPPVDWIGTSMGGLIGMVLAAEQPESISRLVVNDIGPFVASATLAQIRSYLGLDLVFADPAELVTHLRQIHASFGPLTDEQWRMLALHSGRREGQGLRLHYDPAIREPFLAAAEADIDLWQVWDRIGCPVLVLHGAQSVLLTDDVVAEMHRRGPAVKVVTLPGIGHAPALMADDQIQIILRWLGV